MLLHLQPIWLSHQTWSSEPRLKSRLQLAKRLGVASSARTQVAHRPACMGAMAMALACEDLTHCRPCKGLRQLTQEVLAHWVCHRSLPLQAGLPRQWDQTRCDAAPALVGRWVQSLRDRASHATVTPKDSSLAEDCPVYQRQTLGTQSRNGDPFSARTISLEPGKAARSRRWCSRASPIR